jgi:hypothetical protein
MCNRVRWMSSLCPMRARIDNAPATILLGFSSLSNSKTEGITWASRIACRQSSAVENQQLEWITAYKNTPNRARIERANAQASTSGQMSLPSPATSDGTAIPSIIAGRISSWDMNSLYEREVRRNGPSSHTVVCEDR